jgi:hypothetical protein
LHPGYQQDTCRDEAALKGWRYSNQTEAESAFRKFVEDEHACQKARKQNPLRNRASDEDLV